MTATEPFVRTPPTRVKDEASGEWTRADVANWLESLALVHVVFPAAIALVAVLGFALSQRLGPWALVWALLGTAATLRYACGDECAAARILIVAAAIHVIAGLAAAWIPDGSWDGLAYQQEGVLRLAGGWNPLFEDGGPYGIGDPVYHNHFPKLPWINAAVVLLSTGAIEAGKLFNVTLMVAAGATLVATLLRVTALSVGTIVALAAVATLNPVVVSQMATFYVDGALASSLTVMIAGIATYVATGGRRPLALALVAACLAVNIKFTGLAYVVVLVSAAVPIALLWRGRKAAIELAVAATAAGIVGVIVLGYSPYVRNLVEQGDIFYSAPHAETDRIRPVNLNGANRFERFFSSNFSPSSATRAPERTHLKWPFWIGRNEARALYAADLEIGGFGPLYGGSLILALIGALALVASRPTRRVGGTVYLIAGCLLASIFVHGETWWARYVPQAWLLPVLVALGMRMAPPQSLRRWIGAGIVALLAIDISIVAANVAWDELRYVRWNRATMEGLSAARQPIPVYFATFRSLRERLHEAGVQFRAVDTPLPPPARRHDFAAPGNYAAWFD